MSVEFHDSIPAIKMIAELIREENAGACSDEPRGERYPGVPSAREICEAIGANPDLPLSECQWFAACDAVGVPDLDA